MGRAVEAASGLDGNNSRRTTGAEAASGHDGNDSHRMPITDVTAPRVFLYEMPQTFECDLRPSFLIIYSSSADVQIR